VLLLYDLDFNINATDRTTALKLQPQPSGKKTKTKKKKTQYPEMYPITVADMRSSSFKGPRVSKTIEKLHAQQFKKPREIDCKKIRETVAPCLAHPNQPCPLNLRWSEEISKKCTSPVDSRVFRKGENTLDLQDLEELIRQYSQAVWELRKLVPVLDENRQRWYNRFSRQRIENKLREIRMLLDELNRVENSPLRKYLLKRLPLVSGQTLTVRESEALPETIDRLRRVSMQKPLY
jgi:hypothetical protein